MKTLLFLCAFAVQSLAAAPPDVWRDHTLDAMDQELNRNFKRLRMEDFEAPYYLAFALQDVKEFEAYGSYGSVTGRHQSHYAFIRTDLRVGSPKVDNTQVGEYPASNFFAPVDDKPEGLRTAFWLLCDGSFKSANQRLNHKKAWLVEHAEEKDRPDDFSTQKGVQMLEHFEDREADQAAVEESIRQASSVFRDYPQINGAQVHVSFKDIRKLLTDSEGGRVAGQEFHWVLDIEANAQAEDGAPISQMWNQSYVRYQDMPGPAAMAALARSVADNLDLQRKASSQEPFTGPVLLSGEASGVFMHEVLGHRLECERQKDDKEGQTFKDKVGKKIMADFLSVEDDPTLQDWGPTPLNGHYQVDDQGVPSQTASLVKDGKLTGFLMSRSPIKGFDRSNGHGRCDAWHSPCGRMGNLIVRSSRTMDEDKLYQSLVQECRKQKLPYGLYIKRIQGGDTVTRRGDSQAFRGIPLEVYRVSAKDGSRTLVRGVEIVGTPLNSLTKIIATGKEASVFNGVCGAASGWVYVSAVSPSLLISEMEVQGQHDEKSRPRILPPPFADVEEVPLNQAVK